MNMHEAIADRIVNHPRLRGVPPPVVEEVVRLAFAALENACPPEMTVEAIMAGEFERCEACGDVAFGEGVTHAWDSEHGDLAFCRDCAAPPVASEEAGS